MSQADHDDELDSPLLSDEEGGNSNAEQSANNGVTLHGETVDLRHMLLGQVTSSGRITIEEEDEALAEEHPLSQQQDSPTSMLSLDNDLGAIEVADDDMI